VGIERDPVYFDYACQRIQAAVREIRYHRPHAARVHQLMPQFVVYNPFVLVHARKSTTGTP